MGLIGDLFGGSETQTTNVQLTAEQQQLIQSQLGLADFQLAELQRQQQIQAGAFGDVFPSLEGFEQFAGDPESAAAIQDELTQLQLERIRSGGEATDRERDLINQATEFAIRAGNIDISRFEQEGLETLREELAPQLGLRPGDTPILDRGARVSAEALRQRGQLSAGLRGQQAQSLLQFPQQRTALLGDLSQNVLNFQNTLRQNAFFNRLGLAGQASTAGLGLAGVAPNVGAALGNVNISQTTDESLGLGAIAGGVGGILSGLGAIGEGGGFSGVFR